jgi:hypothetical protein
MAKNEENKTEELNPINMDLARPVKQKRLYNIELGKYSRQENLKNALDIIRLMEEYNNKKDNKNNIISEPEL